MALPNRNIELPTRHFRAYFDDLANYDGWLVGDVSRISSSFRVQPITHRSQLNDGLVGAASRAWLGKPSPQGESRTRLHMPLAQDIATLSADYLFSEPPRAVLPGRRVEGERNRRDAMQERMEQVINTPDSTARCWRRTRSPQRSAARTCGSCGIRAGWRPCARKLCMLTQAYRHSASATWSR